MFLSCSSPKNILVGRFAVDREFVDILVLFRGRSWPTMTRRGRPWPAIASHGQKDMAWAPSQPHACCAQHLSIVAHLAAPWADNACFILLSRRAVNHFLDFCSQNGIFYKQLVASGNSAGESFSGFLFPNLYFL